MYNVNEAMDKLLQIYRHDFLNALQVIGGLAQLHKTDRLMAYIRKASDEVQQFGRLIGCGDPRLALVVYETLLQDTSGNYLLHVSGTLPLLPEDILKGTKQTLSVVKNSLRMLMESTIAVTITAADASRITVRVICDEDLTEIWLPVTEAAASNGLNGLVSPDKRELLIYLDNHDALREQ